MKCQAGFWMRKTRPWKSFWLFFILFDSTSLSNVSSLCEKKVDWTEKTWKIMSCCLLEVLYTMYSSNFIIVSLWTNSMHDIYWTDTKSRTWREFVDLNLVGTYLFQFKISKTVSIDIPWKLTTKAKLKSLVQAEVCNGFEA